MASLISISIVSHAQGEMIASLLSDLDHLHDFENFEVLLVSNVPEELTFQESDYRFPLKILKNSLAKGFAYNHNASFSRSSGSYFCVLNPDIRLYSNPFPSLLAALADVSIGLAAPLVISPDGGIEDSARKFPTPFTILCKAFGACKKSSYVIDQLPIFPDWVGGMFMVFPRAVFQEMDGFDETYFLYYEDVDICARLTLAGKRIVQLPTASVVHHAQRSSRRKLSYTRWHLQSMLRFFCSAVFWRVHLRGVSQRDEKNSSLGSSRKSQ